MTSTDQKGCKIAADRVCKNFRNVNRRRKIDVYYACRPAMAVNGDSLKKNMGKSVKELETQVQERAAQADWEN